MAAMLYEGEKWNLICVSWRMKKSDVIFQHNEKLSILYLFY